MVGLHVPPAARLLKHLQRCCAPGERQSVLQGLKSQVVLRTSRVLAKVGATPAEAAYRDAGLPTRWGADLVLVTSPVTVLACQGSKVVTWSIIERDTITYIHGIHLHPPSQV